MRFPPHFLTPPEPNPWWCGQMPPSLLPQTSEVQLHPSGAQAGPERSTPPSIRSIPCVEPDVPAWASSSPHESEGAESDRSYRCKDEARAALGRTMKLDSPRCCPPCRKCGLRLGRPLARSATPLTEASTSNAAGYGAGSRFRSHVRRCGRCRRSRDGAAR